MGASIQNLEELKKLWTQQLYVEYDAICFRYKLRLEKPLLRILDLSSRWGHWDPLTRTIALATRLITEHSWMTVLEVFKHEIAHQYVEEFWGHSEQHGPYFLRACEQLGVEKWAQRSEIHTCPQLDTSGQGSIDPNDEALLRRVERLLALSQSANEHEALAAMNKVAELHEKYQIARLKVAEQEDFMTLVIDHKLARLPSFHANLASILMNSFPVHVIFSSLYDPQKDCTYKVLEILGSAQNVKLADYVYWFLFHQLRLLWQVYQSTHPVKGIAARNSYYLGILNGFSEQLAKSRKSRLQDRDLPPEERTLIVLGEERLDRYLSFRHPRLHTTRSTQRSRYANIYHDGIAKGKQLKIHQGLNDVQSGAHMKRLAQARP